MPEHIVSDTVRVRQILMNYLRYGLSITVIVVVLFIFQIAMQLSLLQRERLLFDFLVIQKTIKKATPWYAFCTSLFLKLSLLIRKLIRCLPFPFTILALELSPSVWRIYSNHSSRLKQVLLLKSMVEQV